VILIDVNLLIYAVNEDAPHHREARAWLEAVLSGEEILGLSWVVVLAFLRLTTRPGLFARPLSIERALDLMQAWLDCEAVRLVHPGPGHAKILRELLLKSGSGGNLTTDAHLAALAIEHNAEFCSLDRDFARFSGLRWRDPLTVR
jgi:uncharacterized protein